MVRLSRSTFRGFGECSSSPIKKWNFCYVLLICQVRIVVPSAYKWDGLKAQPLLLPVAPTRQDTDIVNLLYCEEVRHLEPVERFMLNRPPTQTTRHQNGGTLTFPSAFVMDDYVLG
jgi:hypothetical protein